MFLDIERDEEQMLERLVHERVHQIRQKLGQAVTCDLVPPAVTLGPKSLEDECRLLEKVLHQLHVACYDVNC